MKKVFVSCSFSEEGIGSLLTQLLAALNVQSIDAIVYRGIDDDRIRVGESIVARNIADIERADLVIAVMSAGYFGSPYCLNEATAAVREHRRRSLPLLAARWPSAVRDIESWPVAAQQFIRPTGATETRMWLDLAAGPSDNDSVRLLCRDACRALGIEYEDEPDPIGSMPLIKRTREAVSIFPVANRARVDGDLRRVVDRLAFFQERSTAHRFSKTPDAFNQMVGDLRSIREYGEQRLNGRAMSYLRLAEAVFTMCAARSSRADECSTLYEQARGTAEQVLQTGDLYTQRDAYVVLGNLALETNDPERALHYHLQASKAAHVMHENRLDAFADHPAVTAAMRTVSDEQALCPRGVSAYVMFDNLLKCRVRLLQRVDTREIDYRAAEWRDGITYNEPAHFGRYGSLMVFAYAYGGHLEPAEKLLSVLERSDDGCNGVHFETWRVLCSLVGDALAADGYDFDGCWVDAVNWLSKRADERQRENTHDIALLQVEGSRVLAALGHSEEGLRVLSRAVRLYPGSIRLRVERAAMAIRVGRKSGMAREDCLAATSLNPSAPESQMPFEESEGYREALYAQGLAFWYLGRETEARDRLTLSQADAESDYEVLVPGAFAAVRIS